MQQYMFFFCGITDRIDLIAGLNNIFLNCSLLPNLMQNYFNKIASGVCNRKSIYEF